MLVQDITPAELTGSLEIVSDVILGFSIWTGKTARQRELLRARCAKDRVARERQRGF